MVLLKRLFDTPEKLIIITASVFFILGILVSSIFWWEQLGHTRTETKNNKFEISQLTEQIQVLRGEKQSWLEPTPTPTASLTQNTFVGPPEVLSTNNTYPLKCYRNETLTQVDSFKWAADLKTKIKGKLDQACLNNTLGEVALFSVEDLGGKFNNFTSHLQRYVIARGEIFNLKDEPGSIYGGCGEIKAWSKEGNIYYECRGGDGAIASWSTQFTNSVSGYGGITKDCNSVGDKETCTFGCNSSNDCKGGQFCNLGNSTCVQQCKQWSDCPGGGYGACKPFGPVRGCTPD